MEKNNKVKLREVKKRMSPLSDVYRKIEHEIIRNMPLNDLKYILKHGNLLGTTNCGWNEYGANNIFKDMIQKEVNNRKWRQRPRT